MATFEESALYKALTAETKDKEAILTCLGSAAADFALRSPTGQTFVHVAATNLRSEDVEGAWAILLCQCDMFIRNINGDSGLDCMIENLPVAWSNKYLKSYLLQLGSEESKINEFAMRARMSGKTFHLRRLAQSAKADKKLTEALTMVTNIEENILEIHKGLRCEQESRDTAMSFSKKPQVTVPDLTGLPSLHIATVHGLKETITTLLTINEEAINAQDNMGRTALHYASIMKGENAEAIVKHLTECKADANIKDINGLDVAAMTASPIDMEEFMNNYKANLERQSAMEMMYRVHEAVISGDLRGVKMALNRRELATKQDASKLTPLHKAVILGNTAVASWISEQFKDVMDIQGKFGLTPMHFAAVVNKELYETLKKAGGDSHTVDTEGNDPEYYKDHTSDFILNLDELKEELLVVPPSRPATAASERAKSAKSTGKPETAASADKQPAAPIPVVMAASKKAPPPETLDAKYIADVLGTPLTTALAEVAEKRPWDPIEYLAQWLYKHKANLNYHQQQIDAVKEAEMEEVRKKEEAENRARRKKEAILLKQQEEEKKKKAEEEERKQREQEELQKKAKESMNLAQRPELATVAEDEETTENAPTAITPRTVVEKDEQGRTPLHNLVAAGGAEVNEVNELLTTSGADLLAERDADGKTARDLAETDAMRECLDAYVINLLKEGDVPTLIKAMENGYSISELNVNPEDHELPEASTQLLARAAKFPENLAMISKLVRSGNLAAVKEKVDNKSLAVCRLNAHGANSLHLAVLHEKADVVQHLVTSYPGLVDCRDFLNRTALHYAHSIADEEQRDALVKILTEGKADTEAVDYRAKKPQDYQELTEEMEAMKESVADEPEATEGEAAADGEQAAADGEQAAADGEPAAGESEQAPAEGEQAPAEGEQVPAEGEQVPAEGEQAPAAADEAAPTEPAAE